MKEQPLGSLRPLIESGFFDVAGAPPVATAGGYSYDALLRQGVLPQGRGQLVLKQQARPFEFMPPLSLIGERF